jgi:arabinofuranosyltransferase
MVGQLDETAVPAPARVTRTRREFIILAAALLLFAAVVVASAWLSDDAYITFRVVENAANGLGLTWNPAERVQAFTHPLWFFLLVAGRAITGELFYTTTWLAILLSVGAVGLLAFRLPVRPATAVLGILILTCSRAFVDFATSGLENSLTYFLLALFLIAFLREKTGPRAILTLSLLAALVMLNRTDALLLLLPALAWAVWRQRSWATLWAAVAGFLPFLLWTGFSLFYYGFPFPNTAYAKLNTGIAVGDLARQGIIYLENSWGWDPITLLTIGLSLALALAARRATHLTLAAGVLLYLLYIVRIGGDFMSGRFLAAPLLVAVVLLMVLIDSRLRRPAQITAAAAIVLVIGLAGYLPVWVAGNPSGDQGRRDGDIADERAYYRPNTGLLTPVRTPHPWVEQGLVLQSQGPAVIEHANMGFLGYYAGPEVHIVDRYGLTDPLLARLPVRDPADWRIGHFQRLVPEGYVDTLRSGQNLIRDPALAAYYDALATITRGPLMSGERWREIWRVNTGFYDYWQSDP